MYSFCSDGWESRSRELYLAVLMLHFHVFLLRIHFIIKITWYRRTELSGIALMRAFHIPQRSLINVLTVQMTHLPTKKVPASLILPPFGNHS